MGGNIITNKQILAKLPNMPINSTMVLVVTGQYPLIAPTSVLNRVNILPPQDGTAEIDNSTNEAIANTQITILGADLAITGYEHSFTGTLPHTNIIDPITGEYIIDYSANPTPLEFNITYSNL